MKNIFLLLAAAFLCVAIAGCSSKPSSESKGPAETAQKGAPAAQTPVVPSEGSATERVKKLWRETRPLIAADAMASLSEAEYQARRHEIFSAWGNLQAQLSLIPDSPALDRSKKFIPKVLKLVEDLYGFPGNTEAERQKRREPVKTHIEKRLSDLDSEINTL
jgi:hypothetical protein